MSSMQWDREGTASYLLMVSYLLLREHSQPSMCKLAPCFKLHLPLLSSFDHFWHLRLQQQDVNTTIRAAPTVLHHKAELHWNVFGSQPRMFRGTITRDRLPNSPLPPWLFRPVVGSFIGSGVGDDTADTSYRHRQTGTSEQASPPPQRRTDRY